MTQPSRKFLLLLISLALGQVQAYSETARPVMNTLATGVIGSYPIGFLFPGFNTAAGIDAAALPTEKATAFQLAVTPPIASITEDEAFASVATANKKMGIGAGYLGAFTPATQYSPSETVNAAFGGLGFKIESFAMGVSVRNLWYQRSVAETSVDLSLMFNGDSGLRVGGVLYGINSGVQLGVGAGFRGGKKYHVEANLLLPPSGGNSLGTSLVVAGAMTVPYFDIFFNVSYFLGGNETFYYINGNYTVTYGTQSYFFYTFGTALWMSDHFNLIFQYATQPYQPVGFLTTGLTIVL